ncbi:MAG: hypothetical protein LBQ13_04265 [Endomicrobium sp.]|jgi:hypothetical protein|nr:hypothetical protein [Endomicrobium sp.]
MEKKIKLVLVEAGLGKKGLDSDVVLNMGDNSSVGKNQSISDVPKNYSVDFKKDFEILNLKLDLVLEKLKKESKK